VIALVVSVLDELEGLKVGARDVESLEEEGAGLDAADYGVAGYRCGLRGSGLSEAFFSCLVGDGGVGEGAFSGRLLVLGGGI
jgi:hypothetical protein